MISVIDNCGWLTLELATRLNVMLSGVSNVMLSGVSAATEKVVA